MLAAIGALACAQIGKRLADAVGEERLLEEGGGGGGGGGSVSRRGKALHTFGNVEHAPSARAMPWCVQANPTAPPKWLAGIKTAVPAACARAVRASLALTAGLLLPVPKPRRFPDGYVLSTLVAPDAVAALLVAAPFLAGPAADLPLAAAVALVLSVSTEEVAFLYTRFGFAGSGAGLRTRPDRVAESSTVPAAA